MRAAGDEPLPGYRLLSPLGKGGFGEVWKCEVPGGLCKAIKFVRGSNGVTADRAADQELRALQHIKGLRHPFLLSIERVEQVGTDLIIVMELADKSLHDLFVERRADGLPGVPRGELVGYLREVAEVLDLMNQEHGLQHLDIKPRNLFLVGKHIKVADFGLVGSLAEMFSGGADLLSAITPLYAAPETFENRITLYTDQYSLAVSYMELLTGDLPFKGKNIRQLMMQVMTAEPDLSALPVNDCDIVARALSKAPADRFASCQEFVEALADAVPRPVTVIREKAHPTSFEFTKGELSNTATVPPDGSKILRRQSRIVQAVRPSGPQVGAEEELSGYTLQEALSRGPGGELWRATGPRGESCLVRFLAIGENNNALLERILALNHSIVPKAKLIAAGPGRVALVSVSGDGSMATRLRECLRSGLPGIPKEELLPQLALYANALDELYHQYQIQHLALSPGHLALDRGGLLLLEFGVAELLMLPLGQPPASLNPRYAAVELFDGLISDACDQYSLALLYQELLVGVHPFRNLNARQLASAKLRGRPDLSLLPSPDRRVVTQALSAEPEQRFRSCREFILALEEVTGHTSVVASVTAASIAAPMPQVAEWRSGIEEIVQGIGRGHLIQDIGMMHFRLKPGVEIEQRLDIRLPAGMGRLKMNGVVEQFRAELLERSESRWVLEVPIRKSVLQRVLGRAPAIVVEVVLNRANQEGLTPMRIHLEARDCGRAKAETLLGEVGPEILVGLHKYFGGQSSRQVQERFPFGQSVHLVTSNRASLTLQGRDLGRSGMCLSATGPIPLGPAEVTLNYWASPLTFRIPARVADCVQISEKEYEVELTFG